MTNQTRDFELIVQLRALRERNNRAALAAIRRGLSAPTSAEVLREVLPFVSAKHSNHEAMYILVAALFATHSLEVEQQSIGTALRRVRDMPNSGDSIEKRFIALLDADHEQVAVHLRHAIQLCQSRNIGVDYNMLLRDVLYWDAPQRWVQLRWARDFWGDNRIPADNNVVQESE